MPVRLHVQSQGRSLLAPMGMDGVFNVGHAHDISAKSHAHARHASCVVTLHALGAWMHTVNTAPGRGHPSSASIQHCSAMTARHQLMSALNIAKNVTSLSASTTGVNHSCYYATDGATATFAAADHAA